MSKLQKQLHHLASESVLFGERLDGWVRTHESIAQENGLRRSQLVVPRMSLGQLRSALRWGPSVGLYGESQCGKSMLVDAFVDDLGAAMSTDQYLLVEDPTPTADWADPARRPLWAGEASKPNGIKFAEWIDPSNRMESTGIICRFTHTRPDGVHDGCFLLELMSLSELVTSLAIGFEGESRSVWSPDRARNLQQATAQLRQCRIEPDREDILSILVEGCVLI